MALADIVKRIEDDAAREAAAVIGAANERAEALLADAEARAAAIRDEALTSGRAKAKQEAARMTSQAKLAARDDSLKRRGELVGEALEETARRLAELPDADYARFLAARIAEAVRGGEAVLLGREDLGRASAVAAELSPLRSDVSISEKPAPFDRGALVEGDRVRADLSLQSIVDERRDGLELVIANVLFGTEA